MSKCSEWRLAIGVDAIANDNVLIVLLHCADCAIISIQLTCSSVVDRALFYAIHSFAEWLDEIARITQLRLCTVFRSNCFSLHCHQIEMNLSIGNWPSAKIELSEERPKKCGFDGGVHTSNPFHPSSVALFISLGIFYEGIPFSTSIFWVYFRR